MNQSTETAERMTCGAGSDGDCYADGCVQVRDGEPAASGRFCPLPIGNPRLALRESNDLSLSPGETP